MENWYFEENEIKCFHTKEKCVINDTVAGSSCCGCGHNPNNMFKSCKHVFVDEFIQIGGENTLTSCEKCGLTIVCD